MADVQVLTDNLDPARAAALNATLGRDDPAPEAGDAALPFYHQIYFWDVRPARELGRDGHWARGIGPVPDLGLPRRMWAGGQLEFHAPLRLGAPASKHTTLERVAKKTGRTGPLGFVTLRHEIKQNGKLCVTEHQDLVYLPDRRAGTASPNYAQAPEGAGIALDFTSTMLFRYSALTFNGHRIHYDHPYATDVEGYDGLVVHGPLLAQLMMLAAHDALGPLEAFSFRARAPVIAGENATLCHQGENLWVRGADGRLCIEAQAKAAQNPG